MPAEPTVGAVLYGAAKLLLLPPGGLIVVGLLGLAISRRWRRDGMWTTAAALIALYLSSTPVGASLLTSLLAPREPVAAQALRSAQALVIPGGGLRAHAAEYGGETLAPLTLERVRYGARLARETGLPVLVSGGRPPGFRAAEAELMRAVLEREFGIPVRWVESASRNTRENAQRSAAMLLPQGVRRIALVVHGFDVPRARAEFEAAGFEVTPAPTRLARVFYERLADYLPNANALLASYYASYELAALAVRLLRSGQ